MKYSRCFLLGSGSLASKCVQYLAENDIPLTFVDSSASFNKVSDGISIESLFNELEHCKESVLLLSIVNKKIIPGKLIHNKNITMVNFHNSLLPLYRGLNVEAWAIYNQEKQTGITFHYISEIIDGGDIIIQKTLDIGDTTTSLELLQRQHYIAFEAFKEFFLDLWAGNCQGRRQTEIMEKIYLSKERPNNGFMDLGWDGNKISAFLRAMDYGALNVLGTAYTEIDGEKYQWSRYTIERTNNDDSVQKLDKYITVNRDGFTFTLKNYKKL